jgi:DNA-binding NtrC family response regulator
MPSSPHALARRAVVLSERSPEELAKALAAAGLEIRRQGDPCAPDVLLADPLCLAMPDGGLEAVIATRAGALLARLGDAVPALHETVMGQTERGLFKAVLAHTRNHLGRASKILGLDRNTCARKARAFGLVVEPCRGRKPKAGRPAKGPGAPKAHPPRHKRSR